ncbi:MAG: 50S ribosome-binding GTPase [Eggerthellaceae bacterium]|nr:50S ribosome-binding GTPase [Eggerthellaceae bacterium]
MDRIQIGFFGKTNVGKSSLVNLLTSQELSIVSAQAGTTTDPVLKNMEILPLGPVTIIDTPGLDDVSKLGEKRVAKARQVLNKADIAVLVVECYALDDIEQQLIDDFKKRNIQYIVFKNSKLNVESREQLIAEIISAYKKINENLDKTMLDGLVEEKDIVVMVCPIDESAPKDRLILPQVNAIRAALDKRASSIVCQLNELDSIMNSLKEPPKLVITDSQVIKEVSEILPEDQPFASFSILLANKSGILDTSLEASKTLKNLNKEKPILLAEACTHHRQCNDIGSVKIPQWLESLNEKKLQFEFCSGHDLPVDMHKYQLVIHCGGCMLTDREVRYRMQVAKEQGIPFINYGVLISYVQGINFSAIHKLFSAEVGKK